MIIVRTVVDARIVADWLKDRRAHRMRQGIPMLNEPHPMPTPVGAREVAPGDWEGRSTPGALAGEGRRND